MSLIFFVVFAGFSLIADDVYGLMIPLSPEELYEQSQTIFVGNITSVNILEFEKSSTSYIEKDGIETEVIESYILSLDEYVVKVEEFVKNPQDSSTITVRQPTTSTPGHIIPVGGFELGDRVLFYIQNLDNVNEYSFSSFKIPQQCDPKTVLEKPRIKLRNYFEIFQDGITKNDNFSEGIPMEFVLSKDMDSLYGGSIDVIVSIRKEVDTEILFEKNIHSELERCNWIASAKWEFTPEEGKHRMYLNVKENEKSGGDESYTGFNVIPKSPLKQFHSGIPFEEIKCKENLALIQKYNGSPACVKPETKQKLLERGWTIHTKTERPSEYPNACPPWKFFNETTKSCDVVLPCPANMIFSDVSQECEFRRTLPPEPEPELFPEPEPESKSEITLHEAKKSLQNAYETNVNLGPYYMKDVIVGYGTYDETLIIDIPLEYTNSIQVIKKEVRHIVGDQVTIDYAIYDEPIERHISTVIPYLWNKVLHQEGIDYVPKNQTYWNHADGFAEHDKVCSPIIASNGTGLYISTTFDLEPFVVTGTHINKKEPEDCHKIWKTESLMVEPDRVTALWLKNQNDRK